MRIRTKKIAANEVRWSYWVQFLRWLGERIWNHAEEIVEREFSRDR